MLNIDQEIDARAAEKLKAANAIKAREAAAEREQAAKVKAEEAAQAADRKHEADLRTKLRQAIKARDAADSTAAQARAAIEMAEEAVRVQAAKAAQFEGLKARIADTIATRIAEAAATGADADLTLPPALESEKARARQAEADLAAAREKLDEIRAAQGPLSARAQAADQAAYDAAVEVQRLAGELVSLLASRYAAAVAKKWRALKRKAGLACAFGLLIEETAPMTPRPSPEFLAAFGVLARMEEPIKRDAPAGVTAALFANGAPVPANRRDWKIEFDPGDLAEGHGIWTKLFSDLTRDADAKPALEA